MFLRYNRFTFVYLRSYEFVNTTGFPGHYVLLEKKTRPVEQFMVGSWVADWQGGLIILKIVVLGVIDVKYFKEKNHVAKLAVLKHRIKDAENENSNSVFCILLCQIS